jgi:formamidopyrimidine-DNA glycosylase
MPELPDLVHVSEVLRQTVVGKTILGVRVGDPVVLRLMAQVAFPNTLCGNSILEIERRGHFLRFRLQGDLLLVINSMLAGRYILTSSSPARAGKNLILGLAFADGQELRYEDELRMGKIYLATTAQEQQIPGYRDLGVDVMSESFDLARFRELIARRRDQVRQFLLDKKALASIGNAYADEILFGARIHPKTFCHRLPTRAIDTLFHSIRGTLEHAVAEIRKRGEPVDTKVRDFLSVRGKARQPCPVCGTRIRMVRVGRADACFCPNCQPTERVLFVDFRKLPNARNRND